MRVYWACRCRSIKVKTIFFGRKLMSQNVNKRKFWIRGLNSKENSFVIWINIEEWWRNDELLIILFLNMGLFDLNYNQLICSSFLRLGLYHLYQDEWHYYHVSLWTYEGCYSCLLNPIARTIQHCGFVSIGVQWY